MFGAFYWLSVIDVDVVSLFVELYEHVERCKILDHLLERVIVFEAHYSSLSQFFLDVENLLDVLYVLIYTLLGVSVHLLMILEHMTLALTTRTLLFDLCLECLWLDVLHACNCLYFFHGLHRVFVNSRSSY